jgi:hypothetical protein
MEVCMRRIETYIRKYGPVDGPIIYKTQSQAAPRRVARDA